jgi:hypothetical protein
MIRGDRYLGVYHYQRQGRAHGDVHRFRLALADLDALEQAQRFIGRRLEYVEVEITGATSQTLTGHESIVSRASS